MDNTNVLISRKSRWLFEVTYKDVTTGPHFVKVTSRPQIEISETKQHDGTTTLTSKCQSFTTTYVGMIPADQEILCKLIGGFYKLGNELLEPKNFNEIMEKSAGKLGKGVL